MAIVNVTPDSFFDGGTLIHLNPNQRLQHIEGLINEGADIIDIGAESTRPNAQWVDYAEQRRRIGSFISDIKRRFDTLVAIDTSDAQVMQFAIDEGVDIINDTRALTQQGALTVASNSEVGIILMHMQGNPATMQQQPNYSDVTEEVATFLHQRIEQCRGQGIAPQRIMIDPGFGFGKTTAHNITLLRNLRQLNQSDMAYPIVSGLSRKSLIADITQAPLEERLPGSITLMLLALLYGSNILRVHDVKESHQAQKIWHTIRKEATHITER